MMIPLRIETLLEGQVVEKNRVEYKKGWNPSAIIHTICAFANDFDNVNGGYVVIGVVANDGIPELPPIGIKVELLDSIQQEIFQYCNCIEPRYIPDIEVIEYPNPDTHLIYLKCSAGDAGPYQAQVDVYSKKGEKSDKTMKYWIRPASLTTAAKPNEISELYEKFNSVPYDDRINRMAKLDDIRRGFVEDFLNDSNSSLVEGINNRTLEDLLLSLEVANETDTDLAIRNIGILMFSERPDKLIPGAQINLVKFNTSEAEASRDFIEKTFTGPIWKQIKDVLDYISTNVIEGKVIKISNQAESMKYYNYPYNALEEAIVNAVFHKSYKDDSPVEIRVYVDEIVIINYPGPEKWIDMNKFVQGKVRARKYRNRRIGEFFKELDLSEKQSTGIPTILSELNKNGSPIPQFVTDDERNYLETTIKIRDGFDVKENFNQKNERSLSEVLSEVLNEKAFKKYGKIIETLQKKGVITPKEAELKCGKSSATTRRYMNALIDTGYVKQEGNTNNILYVNILYKV